MIGNNTCLIYDYCMSIVYILTNESMSDTVKIGITDNLNRRVKELDVTSTPLPFECYYAVQVEEGQDRKIEKLLHDTFDQHRVRQNREFFYINPETAKSALKIVETMGGKDVTPKEEIVVDEQDKQALQTAKSKSRRIDYFGILGISVGTILTFSKDNTITCEVAENGQVKFRGETTSLSGSALTITNEMGYEWGTVQGAGYWCHQGRTLRDLVSDRDN